MHRTAAALHVEDLTPDRILDFLEDLETTRRNTIRTRNARLAAIHSFFRYVLDMSRSVVVGFVSRFSIISSTSINFLYVVAQFMCSGVNTSRAAR